MCMQSGPKLLDIILLKLCTIRMRETLLLLQKLLVTRYLWVTGRIWRRIPMSLRSLPAFVSYGTHLHSLVLRFADRRQNHSTFFLRNRAELELVRRLAVRGSFDSTMDIAVFGCSKGAEVYSIAWMLKTARPELTINIRAIDISQEIVEFARQGVYSLQDPDAQATVTEAQEVSWNTHRDQPASPLDWMSDNEKNQVFDCEGDYVRVKSWIKEGISWHCADAGGPGLPAHSGPPRHGSCEPVSVPYEPRSLGTHLAQPRPRAQTGRIFVCFWRRPRCANACRA